MSTRETALAALFAVLATGLSGRTPAPVVLRNETEARRITPGGLVVLRDGETTEQTAILSPLSWQIEHRATLEVTVVGATPAARSALLDALLVDIGLVATTDRTLGGAVEWLQPEAPAFEDVEFDGASSARAASVPVTLWFTVAGSPLA